MNKLSKIPKGRDKQFARGGKTPMFGKSDRAKSAYPASPQRPGQTAQHGGKSMSKRTGAKVRSAAVDEAGSMGGSRAASQPRRPAA
jgi:hypothetical protein